MSTNPTETGDMQIPDEYLHGLENPLELLAHPTPSTEGVDKQIEKELRIFQDYTASWGFPMNQKAHYEGLEIVVKKITAILASQQSDLIATVRSRLEKKSDNHPVMGYQDLRRCISLTEVNQILNDIGENNVEPDE